MIKDEALQLALDSMKEIIHWYAVRDRNDVFLNFVDQNPEIQKIMKSITAIKEALETKDEPVGWIDSKGYMICAKTDESCRPLYTTPQTKEWIGLTKEKVKNEIEFFFRHSYVQDIDRLFLFVQTIEAKLKDKNT